MKRPTFDEQARTAVNPATIAGIPCREHPEKELWFAEGDPAKTATAQAVCAVCPARAVCRQFGLATRQFGIWGGAWMDRGKLAPALGELHPVGRPAKAKPAA